MSGWYKQQRNRSERPWFKNAKAAQLYDYLKDVAYVQDGKYEGQLIRRGSCPTTRAEMMEATGQTYGEIRQSLKILTGYGEIILRASNQFTIITVCDYDACGAQNTLFDDYSVQRESNGGLTVVQRESNGSLTPPINIKEERIEDSLISSNDSYKTERDKDDMVLEIKKRYNRFFDGMLPPLLRLHLPVRNMAAECIRRFGMQSVDIVFEQVKAEKFSQGSNRTGFIANFQYIFEPANFQKYLERAMLRIKKTSKPQQAPTETCTPDDGPQMTDEERERQQKEHLIQLVRYVDEHPRSLSRHALVEAYKSGELSRHGISWSPENS